MKDKFGLSPGKSVNAGDNWYSVIQHVGTGGNGTVFLMHSTGGKYKGCIFAMKVFHKESDARRQERFLNEVEYMRRQHHPSIMKEYDSGVYKGRPFVIMEYLPNTLERALSKRTSLTLPVRLMYSIQLLSAVKHLHETNKIHRDIKPGNIFINNTSAVLGDFGLIADSEVEEKEDKEELKGYIIMPRFYRTPELVRYANSESKLRKESDVFQLGLVFAYMFSQKNPLRDANNLLDEIELDEVVLPKTQYNKRITGLINEMLEKDPDVRLSLDDALDGFNGILEDVGKRGKEHGLRPIK